MKTKIMTTMMAAGVAVLMSACGGGGQATGKIPPPVRNISKAINLVPVVASEDVNQALRDIIANQNDAQLEASKSYCRYESSTVYTDAPATSSPSAANETGASSFTDTNTQESGVDEADLIKTNGQYAYALSGTKLRITKIWPVSEFKSVGELQLAGTPQGIILSGNVVVVFAQDYSALTSASKTSVCMSAGCGSGNGSTIRNTVVTMVDVTDPATPSVMKEFAYEGSLVSQRRIGDKIYAVVASAMHLPSDLGLITIDYKDRPLCDAKGKPTDQSVWSTRIDEVKRQNIDIISNADFSKSLPGVPAMAAVRTYASPSATDTTVTQVITLSIQATDNASDVVMVLGGGTTVYASEKSLIVADTRWYEDDSTLIHRFSLQPQTDYAGSTQIDGHLINQFALGEYNDVLRVATTKGSESTVYTLDATSPELTELGKITGIGKGEKLFSVRFVGPRGFVVTFKKIDPLFVLNLRDPRNPIIMGELKIPGVSTYLHPFGENYLFGVGPNVLQDGFSVDGFKISLFDVSDSAAPKEIQSVVIGKTWMSKTLAMSDHHAFTFDPKSQLLVLPVSSYDNYSSHKDGLNLYHVSTDKGFELLGSNVSTNGNTPLRAILIDDAQHSSVLSYQNAGLSLHQRDAQLASEGTVTWSDVSNVQTMMLGD